ncbi:MAG: hypothetical protein HC840_11835 [Leptolyngbyaceae cyanobacterium RM2_2_4]|nr:hypothetical protein [Leptolyngbyaceae cyanobacterium SM1_4_3]NJN92060.1 hypothetical protein [Leptolyngbyaceae cyanobacterium SL_5_14]NJO50006.1 hypothetical protein [Leptolyngbyaceae cyanobacterium RM2_2_4]
MKKLALLSVAILVTALSIFWGNHANAVTSSPTIPGLIVRTPAEMGLEYLQEPIPRPIASLVDSIIPAARERVQRSDNIQVAVLIPRRGTVTPVANRAGLSGTPNSLTVINPTTGREDVTNLRPQQLAVVGNRMPDGRVEALTPTSLDGMFAEEARRGGSFRNPPRTANNLIHEHEYLVADASGQYAQANAILTFTLIAIDQDSGDVLEIPGVEADSFCIDALNAVFDNALIDSNFDASSLNTPRTPRLRLPSW